MLKSNTELTFVLGGKLMSSFTTKARTVELLGRKQIRDSVTALAELMKNSYDADAPSLRVEFRTSGTDPHIIIADTGEGMNEADVENKWLVLGTSSKTHRRSRKTPSGRPLMGAKGIGRLASATVGRQLWMFTKTEESLWNIVYIHWSLFENPNIVVQDINIPTRFNISKDELLLRFDDIATEMKDELLKNLEKNVWQTIPDDNNKFETEKQYIEELRNTIKKDVEFNTISSKSVSKFIKGFNHGTVLLIDKLYDDWSLYLEPISSEARMSDPMIEKMSNRFSAFVATLRSAYTDRIPFDVQIYYNNFAWEEDYGYSEEDYKIYDLKIEGKIEHGKFFGSLAASNADKSLLKIANRRLNDGLDVTAGIADWREKDCGMFFIKFCHIEGQAKRSSLSPDDYTRIQQKLKLSCGISVYRDGVRILPYGEPENDFLNIEERRSQKAGRYIFSHRNIFGRIDINSIENPNLEDKSSREGLIENAYYYYFVKVIENLLITVALDYLSTVKKESLGIQQSYVKRNQEIENQKRVKEALEKKEEVQRKALHNHILQWLTSSTKEIDEVQTEVNRTIQDLQNRVKKLSVLDGYNCLHRTHNYVSLECGKLRALVNRLHSFQDQIPTDENYLIDENDLEEVEKANHTLDSMSSTMLVAIDVAEEELIGQIQMLVLQWSYDVERLTQRGPEELKNGFSSRLNELISEHRQVMQECAEQSRSNREQIIAELKPIDNYLNMLRMPLGITQTQEWKNAEGKIQELAGVRTGVEDLYDKSPQGIAMRLSELESRIENINSEIYHCIVRLRSKQNSDYAKAVQMQSNLLAAIQTEDNEVSDKQIIGFLRQENIRLESELEIYSDLANMGLAAEIVNHEFNQLFINVNNAIRNMKQYVRSPNEKYWLDQIQMGFRSISDRQNQLSPMYRTYSLRKAKTNLYQFIEEVRKFTNGELERNSVVLENHVPRDVEIYISKSKVFPALSNLINNAIYWVLNQKSRIIRIRYNEEERTLYVEDSGTGIVASNKEKIFEPFVSFKPNGRGLGLTISRKVLESQGHKLDLADDDEKTLPGACFKIVFNKDIIGD